MKKTFLLTAFAVLGLVAISCSSDDNENMNNLEKSNADTSVFSREGDSINVVDTTTVTTQVSDPGPGDDPIIVPPPPTKP